MYINTFMPNKDNMSLHTYVINIVVSQVIQARKTFLKSIAEARQKIKQIEKFHKFLNPDNFKPFAKSFS